MFFVKKLVTKKYIKIILKFDLEKKKICIDETDD
jgi:hypothetical protein